MSLYYQLRISNHEFAGNNKSPQFILVVQRAKKVMALFIMLVAVSGSIMILIICLHKCAIRNKNRPQTQEQMEWQQKELEEQLYNLNII